MRVAPQAGPADHHQPWLDVVRALAALLVLVSHIRSFTLMDAAGQPSLSVPARVLFAATGLGHEAVIVFFVLSGFLVTASMVRLRRAGAWSLTRFAVERLIRLWVVLIPCLILGGVLDAVGLHLAASRGTVESYGHLALTPAPAPPAQDVATLLGNLCFLQTIAVPVWGSNGPLWSLAAEAWFYALAALAFTAWLKRRRIDALVPLLAFLAVATWLPWRVLVYFPVWLLGAGCAVLHERRKSVGADGHLGGIAANACFCAALVLSRVGLGPGWVFEDLVLAFASAWLLLCAVRWPWIDRWWSRALRRLSAPSYSLYLSHVPVLALFKVLAVGPHRLALNGASLALMTLEAGLALGCAAALWWGFERHTGALRRRLLGMLVLPRTANITAVAAGSVGP